MTSLAAMLGMLPLALALGAGAQMLQPLAIAVIGGLASALLLSLVVTPTVYGLLRRKVSRPLGSSGESPISALITQLDIAIGTLLLILYSSALGRIAGFVLQVSVVDTRVRRRACP
jgi:hypothetical protein